MPWIPFLKEKKWYHYRTLWIAVFLLAGYLVLGKRVMRRYDRWDAKRSVERAKVYFENRDYKHAMLDARRALDVNPADVEATRILAKSVEAVGAPGAVQWRNRLDSIIPGDPENVLAWAKDAVKEGDLNTAERVLKTLKPADQANPLFHDLSASIAMGRRDRAGAEAGWEEAIRLDPKEERYQLSLAVVRMESTKPGIRAAAGDTLREMAGRTPKNLGALRALIADAMRRREFETAKELTETLAAEPRAVFADKLIRLSVLRSLNDQLAPSYLTELRDASMAKPADLTQLLVWMNSQNLAIMVEEWTSTFPTDMVSKPPVCVVLAESSMKASRWTQLRALVEKGNWAEADYLRRAFLARALERLGDPDAGAAEWKEALAASLSGADALLRLQALAKACKEWGWKERGEEVLWKMSGYYGCPRWALDALWEGALQRGDSAQLQAISRILAKANSKDFGLRNNYIFLSLLTRTEEGNPQQAAEELYREHPGNPIVASTYALALYQKGMSDKAVAVMSALKPLELQDPQVAIYYGIFLTAAGHAAKAEEYLRLGADWPLMAEEKALLTRVKVSGSKETVPENPGASKASKDATQPAVPATGGER